MDRSVFKASFPELVSKQPSEREGDPRSAVRDGYKIRIRVVCDRHRISSSVKSSRPDGSPERGGLSGAEA
jgi:hypothetical protein